MKDRRVLFFLALCFLLSGFAALLYQTVWTRQFAFVFGTSELAVATVLAAYMGGLAAGALVAGRLAPRVRRPVRVYGWLELGVAVSALAMPFGIQLATAGIVALFGGSALEKLEAAPIVLYRLVSSFAIVLVPTFLMGATLPLLARHAVRRDAHVGPRIAMLYAVNTAGAVLGTLCAAFVLMPRLGLANTVLVGVACNLAVFGVAAMLARLAPWHPPSGEAAAPRVAFGWVLPAMAVSGALSFAYEVLWTRLLSQLLGGSVFAFATMLASFLTGIALGSALAARAARSPRQARRAFVGAQAGAGLLSLAAFLGIDELAARIGDLARIDALPVDVIVAGAVLLPSTLCIGATFPLAVRVLCAGPEEASGASARVYTWNTAGAIAGALATAFFALPALGFSGTIAACTAGNLLLAAWASFRDVPARRRLPAMLAAGAVGLLLWPPPMPWTVLRTVPLRLEEDRSAIAYFGVGRSATVLLTRREHSGWRLRTNGLPESLVGGREAPPVYARFARWLTWIPSLVRSDVEEMLVVGLGGGVSVEVLPSTLRRVDVIEIEPEVLEANRVLSPLRRHDPLTDPRVAVHLHDARAALMLSEGRYDAIAAQASHPWTAGSSHLYTREFFGLVAERLRDDGVFVQWMGSAFLDEDLVKGMLATLRAVWPHVRVYGTASGGELLFTASARPLEDRMGVMLATEPAVLAELGLRSEEDLLLRLLVDEARARELAAGSTPFTDDRNRLQMRSPQVARTSRDLRFRAWLTGPEEARIERAPDPLRMVRSAVESDGPARALALIRALPEEPLREAAAAVAEASGPRRGHAWRVRRALAEHAAEPEVRAAFLRVEEDAIRAGLEVPGLARARAGTAERSVTDAWREAGRGEWAGVAEREAALAAVPRAHPLRDAALRLRAEWRIASADPARSHEAIAILDEVLARKLDPSDAVLRARAAEAAGHSEAVLGSLSRVLATGSPPPALHGPMRALLEALPAASEPWRSLQLARVRGARPPFARAAAVPTATPSPDEVRRLGTTPAAAADDRDMLPPQ